MAGATLGVLAGGGPLPRFLVETCRAEGRGVFVIAFEGITEPETVAAVDHRWLRLAKVGALIEALHDAGAEELVLAGHIKRPPWSSLIPDLRGARLLRKLRAGAQGDNAILSLILDVLEGDGFTVVGAHQVAPSLLATPGPVGRLTPDAAAAADIERGIAAARAIGARDIGQAAVVQHGVVLAVETAAGTDAMVAGSRDLRRGGPGGVLVKCCKPQQDTRVDMPTIGPRTVAVAAAAGLAGIAVEAGATLVLERQAVARAADAAGLFVIGFEAPG